MTVRVRRVTVDMNSYAQASLDAIRPGWRAEVKSSRLAPYVLGGEVVAAEWVDLPLAPLEELRLCKQILVDMEFYVPAPGLSATAVVQEIRRRVDAAGIDLEPPD
jgi:hypothetical protein